MLTEVESVGQLEPHQNIIQLKNYGTSLYDNGKGKKEEKSFVAFELAQGGELINLINQ